MTHFITKYKNRKLYSLTTKGYVTLTSLTNEVKQGNHFEVTCHESGSDLTQLTLMQCVATLKLSQGELLSLIKGTQ